MNDVEVIVNSFETYMKANLNTYISAINTEKSDSITLATVSASAFFFQSMNDRAANYDPYVSWGVSQAGSVSEGAGVLRALSFYVILVVSDRGEEPELGRKMLRYSRALEDLFSRGWAKIRPDATLRLTNLGEVAFRFQDSQDPYRAVGVELQMQFG